MRPEEIEAVLEKPCSLVEISPTFQVSLSVGVFTISIGLLCEPEWKIPLSFRCPSGWTASRDLFEFGLTSSGSRVGRFLVVRVRSRSLRRRSMVFSVTVEVAKLPPSMVISGGTSRGFWVSGFMVSSGYGTRFSRLSCLEAISTMLAFLAFLLLTSGELSILETSSISLNASAFILLFLFSFFLSLLSICFFASTTDVETLLPPSESTVLSSLTSLFSK
mmetsp:Transcript_15267/g.26498  ORF Transcript_15267/g.26498 Transcript_15267/m.26498 type:complete len:219 (+) Transcript_15267:703-1359(+)